MWHKNKKRMIKYCFIKKITILSVYALYIKKYNKRCIIDLCKNVTRKIYKGSFRCANK